MTTIDNLRHILLNTINLTIKNAQTFIMVP